MFSLVFLDINLAAIIERNTSVLAQNLALTRRILANLKDLSTSFHATPVAIRESEGYESLRPPGRGRPGLSRMPEIVEDKKATQYFREWYNTLQNPENTHFGMDESDGVVTFFYQEQMNATRREIYQCDCSHQALSSAFLVYGMCSYNMESFDEFVKEKEVSQRPVNELSPEGTPVSKYVNNVPS